MHDVVVDLFEVAWKEQHILESNNPRESMSTAGAIASCGSSRSGPSSAHFHLNMYLLRTISEIVEEYFLSLSAAVPTFSFLEF